MTCQRERAMSPAACGAIVRSVPKGEEAISEEVDPERAGRKELSACACSRPCCRCPNAAAAVEVVEDHRRAPLLPATPRRLRRAVAVVQRRYEGRIPTPCLDLKGPAAAQRRSSPLTTLRSLLPLLLR